MALPHMRSAITTRKNIYEAAIVRRRNHENDFRQSWTNHAGYFNKSGINADKQTVWTSDKSYQNSMDAWKSTHERETRALNLKRRRLKLAELLQKERDEYQAELKGMSKENYGRLQEMKDEAEGLRSAREEKRKHVAEEKLYQHWRQNNAELRQIESDLHQEHVIERWGDQVEERREREIQEMMEKQEYEEELEKKRIIESEKAEKEKALKMEEERRLKAVLLEQMNELKERAQEAEELKRQQEMLLQEQWELENLEEQRRQMEEKNKKMDLGRVLLRQHHAQMRRRSQQVLEELEIDRQILEALEQQERAEQDIQTARREKAAADAAWMKQVIEEQIRVEKTREAELDMLYEQEAARMWHQREAEWERERQARAKLMREVMVGRQDQISRKIEDVRLQHEESIQRREELLREMELANQMTRREEEDRKAAILSRREDLESQITSRKEKDAMLRLQLEEEDLEDRQAEDDYDQLLQKEAQKLRLRGFEPKIHSRRQAWM